MLLSIGLALGALTASAQALSLSVSSTGGNATLSDHQYGVMFEDINFSGDGGLYAELVRNRAFQGSTVFPSNLTGWSSVGGTSLSLKNLSQPLSNALPTSMSVGVSHAAGERVGFANGGWWGMDVQVQPYNGSFWVKGSYSGSYMASLVSDITNVTYGCVEIAAKPSSSDWVEYIYTLTPATAAPNSNNSLVITFDKSGVSGDSLDFQLISLFPPTYNDRPNGNRKDLMEALAGLNPSFLRMPGGNNIEGNSPPYYWKWNETIGPLQDRPGRPGTWNYQNTDGLGLVEYLWWCQDLGMEPVLAVWAGYYLDGTVIPEDVLGPYVQEALEELEFLMGDASTTYGALRISLGYSEPFSINYVEVGNEDTLGVGNASYSAYRFSIFYEAIKSAYPDITIMASGVDVVLPGISYLDYHPYTRPNYFVSIFNHFDNLDRASPIMVGEYAVVQGNEVGQTIVNWTDAKLPFPLWIGSVSEAVFLIGAERNADVVWGSAYAPTFQNLNEYQWTPNLISYTADPSQDVLSTSWHMINLLSNTRITETLPTTGGDFGPAYWVAGMSNVTGSRILKTAVYNSTGDVPMSVSFDGVTAYAKANLTVLTAATGASYSDIGTDVVNRTSTIITASGDGTFTFSLPDLSVSILEIGKECNSTWAAQSWGWSGHQGWDKSSTGKIIPKGYREIKF